jgi:hypothetical protein
MSNPTDPMDPKEATEAKLCAYLEEELPPNERADIEQHLGANPQHRQLLLDLARTREWMRSLPMETSPVDLAEIVQGQNERSMLLDDPNEGISPWKTRWPQLVTLAAMVLLVAGLGVLVVEMLKGPKSDGSKAFSLAPMSTTLPMETPVKATDEMKRLMTADQSAGTARTAGSTPSAAAPLASPPAPAGVETAPTPAGQTPGAFGVASAMGQQAELKMPAGGAVSDTAAGDDLKAKLLETSYHLRTDEKSVGFVVTADAPATTVEQLQGFFNRHQLAYDSPTGAVVAQLDRPQFAKALAAAASQPVAINSLAVNTPQVNSPAVNSQAANSVAANDTAADHHLFDKAQNTQNYQLQQTKSAAPIIRSPITADRDLRPVDADALPATMPAEPVLYVAHGLTSLQVELLSASLETDNQNQTVQRITLFEPAVAAPVAAELAAPGGKQAVLIAGGSGGAMGGAFGGAFSKGQTLSVTVAQLVGPGIEKTNVVRISQDGTIALPMVDPIPAAGASPAELQQRIAQKYKEANLIPDATVAVADVLPTTQPIESPGISTTLPTTSPASQPAATEPVTPVPAPAPGGPVPAPAPTGPVPAPAPVSPGISVVVLVEKSTQSLPGK